MKKILLILSLILINLLAVAQVNLVPNPSFEELDACPRWLGDIHFKDWWSFRDSPDCFNKNCGVPSCTVPNNYGGYQNPIINSQNGYAGLLFYRPGGAREVIGCQLRSSLLIGQRYFISVLINKADSTSNINQCNIDRICLSFTNIKYEDDSVISNQAPINNHALFYNSFIITDTMNWIRINGSFIADSNYHYLMIGNFFDSLNTSVDASYSKVDCEAYYYVDDICVSTDSAFAFNYIYTGTKNIYEEEKIVTCYPSPSKNEITFHFPTESKDLIMYNVMGQKMSYDKLSFQQNLTKDISMFPNGIYFATIKSNDFLQTIKFIKQ